MGGLPSKVGTYVRILIAKQGTWVNILKLSSILTTDAKIDHFIHATEANKMANLKAIYSELWTESKVTDVQMEIPAFFGCKSK